MQQKYRESYDLGDGRGTALYQIKKGQVYARQCCLGEILAATTTNNLVDRYGAPTAFNHGIAGLVARI